MVLLSSHGPEGCGCADLGLGDFGGDDHSEWGVLFWGGNARCGKYIARGEEASFSLEVTAGVVRAWGKVISDIVRVGGATDHGREFEAKDTYIAFSYGACLAFDTFLFSRLTSDVTDITAC